MTYLLVAVDTFSKFIKLFPLRKANAVAAVNRIIRGLLPIIKPKRILSDHGTQLTSRIWKQRLAELGIKTIYSSIRHASSNPAERYMREIERMFRTYCHQRHSMWASYVQDIEDCLNETPHSSTGCCSTEMITRQKPRYFLDKETQKYIPRATPAPDKNIMRFVKEQLTKMPLNRAKQQRSKTTVFSRGDLVLLRTKTPSNAAEGIAEKFSLLYEGPYRIHQVPYANAYELMDLRTQRIKGVFNTANLRRYYSDT